jgi:hypothetical protein
MKTTTRDTETAMDRLSRSLRLLRLVRVDNTEAARSGPVHRLASKAAGDLSIIPESSGGVLGRF